MREKTGLHERNRHTGRYDFPKLIQGTPELAQFQSKNPNGEPTIDFSNPEAVRVLNRALLKLFYGIEHWDIAPGYLCPPIPGRADYIHHLADLLALVNNGVIPRGEKVRVLDVGTGASGIYPIIGNLEYGWSFLGSEVDPVALASADKIFKSNPQLKGIETRRQQSKEKIFRNLLKKDDVFDLTMCNPPFHGSAEEAADGSRRKWRNLGKSKSREKAPVLNFGGQSTELWTPGGEVLFLGRMIEESAEIKEQVWWFSSLVSKLSHLEEIYAALEDVGATEWTTLDMGQGQKISRAVAWTFKTADELKVWPGRQSATV